MISSNYCCGDFASIIPNFHEIGVDVLNISQPNTVDLAGVGRSLQGKKCFYADQLPDRIDHGNSRRHPG